MKRYEVHLKYGNQGQSKNNGQTVFVEAESDSTAIQIAINKLRNSNSAYRDKEIVADKVKVR